MTAHWLVEHALPTGILPWFGTHLPRFFGPGLLRPASVFFPFGVEYRDVMSIAICCRLVEIPTAMLARQTGEIRK